MPRRHAQLTTLQRQVRSPGRRASGCIAVRPRTAPLARTQTLLAAWNLTMSRKQRHGGAQRPQWARLHSGSYALLLNLRAVSGRCFGDRLHKIMFAAATSSGTTSDCIRDRCKTSRAGKRPFIEQLGYLNSVHGCKKREHTGDRARARNRLTQVDTIDTTEFANVGDIRQESPIFEALSSSCHCLILFRRKRHLADVVNCGRLAPCVACVPR